MKAFTMLELITVMVISAILFSIAYLGYELIYRDFVAYKSDSREALERLEFMTVWERDLFYADSLSEREQEVVIFYGTDSVTYVFSEEEVRREAGHSVIWSIGDGTALKL